MDRPDVSAAVKDMESQPETSHYNYTHQAWVVDGKYVRCGHPEVMRCGCYGRDHEGERE